MADFSGDNGDNSIVGTDGADDFFVGQGGDDTIEAGGGDDAIFFAGAYNAHDVVDGGDGNDRLNLAGDYSAGVIVDFTNVESLQLSSGHDYKIAVAADCFAVAGGLTFDADGLAASDSFSADLRAESAGQSVVIIDDAAAFTIKGGAANERLEFTSSTIAPAGSFSGGAGDDVVQLDLGDIGAVKLNGGKGFDSLELHAGGDYDFTVGTLKQFETVVLYADADFSITTSDANVAKAHSLTIDGHFLSSADSLMFDGSAETNGAYAVIGTAGDDSITGGAGGDTLTGAAGADSFIYTAVSQSSGAHKQFDLITDLSSSDTIDLSAIDANTGKAGNQAFHIVDHFTGAAGQLVLSYSAGKDITTLAGDIDGDGKADISIHADGDQTAFTGFVL